MKSGNNLTRMGNNQIIQTTLNIHYRSTWKSMQEIFRSRVELDFIRLWDAITNYNWHIENIIIDRPLNLLGEDKKDTLIRGSTFAGKVIHIQYVDDVTVKGFTISQGASGIYIENSQDILIRGNEISLANQGIQITEFSRNADISYNNIIHNYEGVNATAGSSNNCIYNNNFRIYFNFST